MPKIPKAVRNAIKDRLSHDARPMTSGQIAESVNANVKLSQRRTPRQMAFILKQMERDGDLSSVVVSKNGINQHGNRRVRVEYLLAAVEDPDVMTKEESQ